LSDVNAFDVRGGGYTIIPQLLQPAAAALP
jgi:hypothetical protein